MLKLGQDVIIYETPAYGDEYFDEDYIYERATICGITTINDELAYQLEGYDEDSWWVEDELVVGDGMLTIEPLFNLGDEVLVHRIGEPDILQTVGAIYGTENDFRYLFEEEGWDAKVHDVGEPEKNLTLSRRKLEYTLF